MMGGGWNLPVGWYVSLHGEASDLQTWLTVLADSRDAKVFARQHDTWFLTSEQFDVASTENDVREAAFTLLDELNVRMALFHATLPIALVSVDRIEDDGAGTRYRVSTMSSLPSVRPNITQAMEKDDFENLPKVEKVRRLLSQLVRSRTWEDVYRTLEFAELLVGGQRLLDGYVSDSKIYSRLRQIANSYRHVTVPKNAPAIRLDDGMRHLRTIVRAALSHAA